MINDKIAQLIDKYLAGQASEEEKAILMEWYSSTSNRETEIWMKDPKEKDDLRHSMLAELQNKIAASEPGDVISMPRKKIWKWVAAAAVIVLMAGSYFIFFTNRTSKETTSPSQSSIAKTDLAPGMDGAILTIGNGQKIVLDSSANGNLAVQGNADVIKNGAQISYTAKEGPGSDEPLYNTLNTPRGRKFELVLADGTKVWLDAASSITYPTQFTGNDRIVQISGQAYFEVAKDPSRPFRVRKGEMEVAVLGTHFNVNAYDDEKEIKITLLEGSVNVSNSNSSVTIKPGEQAVAESHLPTGQAGSRLTIHQSPDLDQVMAWKNGLFSFDKASIQTLLRSVSRWYDVDIVYAGEMPKGTISGKTQRSLTFSQMQRVLQLNNVKFKIEGNKLIVSQ